MAQKCRNPPDAGKCPEGQLPRRADAPKGECPEGRMPRRADAPKGECPEGRMPRRAIAPKGGCPKKGAGAPKRGWANSALEDLL
jgi:hypothetical protein